LNNYLRTFLLLLCDAALVILATVMPYILRFYDSEHTLYHLQGYLLLITLNTAVLLAVFYAFKLYHRAWAYASLGELMAIVQAVTLGSFGTIALSYFAQMSQPRTVVVMQWALAILLVGGSRLAWRILVEKQKINVNNRDHRALIVGAGDAGAMVAREARGDKANFLPVGFVDDNPNKQNLRVLGLPVLGTRKDIPELVNRHKVDLIIIAMPSVGGSIIREIVEICRGTGAELKILPGMYQIIQGRVSVSRLRLVQLDDLLRREPVQVDLEEISGYLKGETVLITGAGGSIGSELCRQVASFGPGRLVLLGHGENSIHKIWMELGGSFKGIPMSIEIADVRDKSRINSIFEKHRPGVVFHAAAHKHVPLMELHPAEAVKTNIFGTRNVALAAGRAGTKVFVMISSDKAVNPSSVMGATKRMAELIIHQENLTSDTLFTAVRFGNVLGSNGSVVPVFQRQITTGGPLTVTHPDMKRYFMIIPEAVQLVIQAAAMARGGEVFVLDMGEPVKILDLAKDVIELTGLKPESDMKIEFTGIRPGEKLFEELLTAEEGSCATKHKRIFAARPSNIEVAALENELVNLSRKGLQCTAEDIFSALESIIPGFKSYRKEQAG